MIYRLLSLLLFLTLFLALFLLPVNSFAHKASDAYLTVNYSNDTLSGQWDIALRDLEFAIGLDQNGDGEISWGELKNKHIEINKYALSKLAIYANKSECSIQINNNLLNNHTDGAYTVLQFSIDCPKNISNDLNINYSINYTLFFDIDRQHRGLLKISSNQGEQSFVFSPENSNKLISINGTNRWTQLVDYTKEGITHILIGFDHILFLIALLLPSVLYFTNGQWIASSSLKKSTIDVLKIITAFTFAHSITLGLATLNLVYLPSRLVESVIAASVIIAAANNIYPFINKQRWKVAFIFGLIHGFGFASVLQDLNITSGNLAFSLIGFNFGVELGQLLIVSLFLPTAFLIRRYWYYKALVLQLGSALIIAISCVWLLERSLDITLISSI